MQTVLLNVTVIQYLNIINLSLTFPAIKKLKMQVKRMRKRETKRKPGILCYLLWQNGGNPLEKYPEFVCWLHGDHSVAKYGSQQQAEKLKLCNKSVHQGTGEPSWQGSNVARPGSSQHVQLANSFVIPVTHPYF